MSLACKGRGCELYNESVMEPSDAVGAGKGITSVEELAERPVLKEGCRRMFLLATSSRDSLFGCLLFI